MDHERTHFQEILRRKRRILKSRKQQVPLQGIRALAMMQTRPLDIASALRADGVSIIAEIKRMLADGDMLRTYDPAALASHFEEGGAVALSVATDETVLRGGLVHLLHVKRAVAIPVIRHDFIFDAYQLYEARAAGADGVRLIARALPDGQMRNLLSLTQRLKMTALVEVQTTSELNRVLPLEPRLIGLNNRDWETGEVNLTITEMLRGRIPPHITVVSGGGIQTLGDAKHIAATGVDAILVGKTLLTAEDSPARLRELLGALNDG